MHNRTLSKENINNDQVNAIRKEIAVSASFIPPKSMKK